MCIRDSPKGVQGTELSYPDDKFPTFIGWNPSTSLLGWIVSITFCLSICLGRGSWTKIPDTVSSLLSSVIFSRTVFSSTVSGYLITSDFKPTSTADFSLLRT